MRNKKVTMILSFIIAFALWAYVIWDTNPVIEAPINNVPVQLLHTNTLEDAGLVILDQQDYTVNLKVQGKKKDIGKLNINDISATADVGGFGAGEVTVAVKVATLDNLSLVAVNPGRLTFTIDKLVTEERRVNIIVNGKTPENTEISNLGVIQDSVQVKGAATYVSQVARIDVEVDASKINEYGTAQVVVPVAVDVHGNPVTGVTVIPEKVDVSSVLYQYKEVPLIVEGVGEVAEGMTVAGITVPERIKIAGKTDDINQVTELKATVDVTGLAENAILPIVYELPVGIKISGLEQSHEATIRVMTIEDYLLEMEQQENNPDDGQQTPGGEQNGGNHNSGEI